MAMELERATKKRRGGIDDLPDDLIVDILSRLPAKSVCRFKCVSWRWRRLISHRDHRKKLPTRSPASSPATTGPSTTTSSSRSPISTASMEEKKMKRSTALFLTLPCPSCLDTCPSLPRIAAMAFSSVCVARIPREMNPITWSATPATQRWIILPEIDDYDQLASIRLCFDPALSPYFHVFCNPGGCGWMHNRRGDFSRRRRAVEPQGEWLG
ncbi:hypothetical protein EE612_026976 [Oryza sativa]|nr:hypothetical protein EE612_026976 [Oryza sativa]